MNSTWLLRTCGRASVDDTAFALNASISIWKGNADLDMSLLASAISAACMI